MNVAGERVIVSGGDHVGYAARARESARLIAAGRAPRRGSRLAVYHAAERLLASEAWEAGAGHPPRRGGAQDAIHALLDAWWPRIRRGRASGEDMLRDGDGVWAAFNAERPMGEYADVVRICVTDVAGDRLAAMRAVEFGAGVGVTTRLLRDRTLTYLATDRLKFRGVRPWDFDEWQWPPGTCPHAPDLLIATNAFHCSADPARLVARCREVLAPSGLIVIGEGSATPAQPWYQDMVMSTLRGWWDRGGFRPAAYWLGAFAAAGYAEAGRYRLYSGGHDLGGAYWARA